MKNTERRGYEMIARVRDFGATHAEAFPAATAGGAMFDELAALVAELDKHTEAQVAHRGESARNTTGLDSARKALRRDLKAICGTAQALSFTTPGLQQRFRMPSRHNDQSLLSAARDIRTAAEPIKADFTRLELPADFADALQAKIERFEAASAGRNASREARVAATYSIKVAVDRGISLVRRLDAVVRNKFRDDPATLAAWESASRVEHAPKGRSVTEAPAKPIDNKP